MSNVVPIGIIPRPEAITTVDITERDLAAEIRRGFVTMTEIAARLEHPTFEAWSKWRGYEAIGEGRKRQVEAYLCLPREII